MDCGRKIREALDGMYGTKRTVRDVAEATDVWDDFAADIREAVDVDSRNKVWLVLKFYGDDLEFLHVDSVWSTVEGAVERVSSLGSIREGDGTWDPVDTAWVQGPDGDGNVRTYFIDSYEVDRVYD